MIDSTGFLVTALELLAKKRPGSASNIAMLDQVIS